MKITASIKALLAVVFLAGATVLHAQSNRVTIGSVSSLTIDMMFDTYTYGSFTLYQDGQPILSADPAGVTYVASGISWQWLTWGNSYVAVYDLTGEISIEANVFGGGYGSYSYSSSSISWFGNWGGYFSVYWY
ncbi:MAG: hypothetical protein QM715_07585 [Nibricoccus sp.]